jgi:hypothetical protein
LIAATSKGSAIGFAEGISDLASTRSRDVGASNVKIRRTARSLVLKMRW